MNIARSSTLAVAYSLLAIGGASAQSGSADLRYAAPLPDSAVFVTIDSMSSTTSGLPTGDMSTSGHVRTTSSLAFSTAGDQHSVTARLHELSGSISTPMGAMPLNMRDVDPLELALTEKGPDPEELYRKQVTNLSGSSPESLIGAQRALAGLLNLPGRVLQIGETWADTVQLSSTIEGLSFDMEVVLHGTYEKDTTVAGRTLNVLRLSTDMTMNSSGVVQGMNMTQDMTSAGEDTILWDSELRIPVWRQGTAEVNMTTNMPDAGMSLVMNSTTRSHTTGSVASGG